MRVHGCPPLLTLDQPVSILRNSWKESIVRSATRHQKAVPRASLHRALLRANVAFALKDAC
jgi:hypothetical protein